MLIVMYDIIYVHVLYKYIIYVIYICNILFISTVGSIFDVVIFIIIFF